MSEISRFFGIVIRMFYFDAKQHHTPHLHAYYAEHVAVFSLPEGERLEGHLPRRQRRLVEAWIEIHHEELMQCWERASHGQEPPSVDPLR